MRQVVHAYRSQILRAARDAGLAEPDAADVTQRTFLTFIESLPRLEGRSTVRNWLLGILHRQPATRMVRRPTAQNTPDMPSSTSTGSHVAAIPWP